MWGRSGCKARIRHVLQEAAREAEEKGEEFKGFTMRETYARMMGMWDDVPADSASYKTARETLSRNFKKIEGSGAEGLTRWTAEPKVGK